MLRVKHDNVASASAQGVASLSFPIIVCAYLSGPKTAGAPFAIQAQTGLLTTLTIAPAGTQMIFIWDAQPDGSSLRVSVSFGPAPGSSTPAMASVDVPWGDGGPITFSGSYTATGPPAQLLEVSPGEVAWSR